MAMILTPSAPAWSFSSRFLSAESKLNPEVREFLPSSFQASIAPLSPRPPPRPHEFSLVQQESSDDGQGSEVSEQDGSKSSGEQSDRALDCEELPKEEEKEEENPAAVGMCSFIYNSPSPVVESISLSRHVAPSSIAREHSSRSLILGNIPQWVDHGHLQVQLEQWGSLRYFSTAAMNRGIITVHYCDLRDAVKALQDIHARHLVQQHQFLLRRRMDHFHRMWSAAKRRDGRDAARWQMEMTRGALRAAGEKLKKDRGIAVCDGGGDAAAVWAKFLPLCCCVSEKNDYPDMANQGTIVVFNLDVAISLDSIKAVLTTYGDVKEVRETPIKRTHKFVEFFDVRDAARAKAALDGQDVLGSIVKIEFSRPGGMLKRHNEHRSIFDLYPVIANSNLQALPWKFPPLAAPPAAPLSLAPALFCPPPSYHFYHAPPSFWFGAVPPPPQITYIYQVDPNQAGGSPSWNFSGSLQHYRRMLEESCYKFDEGVKDQRTTLMIKNIPNKYSQDKLMRKIDLHCRECNAQIENGQEPSAYDFLYLPVDSKNKCNLGYAFINFTSVAACARFYKSFNNLQWEAYNPRKICQITYARIQGRAKLQEHVKRGDGECHSPVFDPPRTGHEN